MTSPRTAIALACAFCLAVLAPTPANARVTPQAQRADVVAGRAMVIPVAVDDREPTDRPVEIRLDDGRRLDATLAAVRRGPAPCRASLWLGQLGPPSVRPAERGRDANDRADHAGWILVADLPADASGQGVEIDRRRVALRWMPRPQAFAERLAAPTDGAFADPEAAPWRSPAPRELVAQLDPDLIDPARLDPFRRWRARLLTGRLGETTPVATEPAPLIDAAQLLAGDDNEQPVDQPDPRPTDRLEPPLEALALLTEDRWRIGLLRLWAADPALSVRVRRVLASAVTFPEPLASPGPVTAPFWLAGDAAADDLLSVLLDDRLNPEDLAERARAWLSALPDSAAWVVADPGRDPLGGGLAIIAPEAGDQLAVVAAANGQLLAEPAPVSPWRAVAIPFDPTPAATRLGGGRLIRVSLSGLTRELAVLDPTLPARPPGVSVGPLLTAWSMHGLVNPASGARGLVAPTTGRLFWAPPFDRPGSVVGTGPVWQLYLECANAPAAGESPTARDRLLVHLRHADEGFTTITVPRDASASQTGPDGEDESPRVRLVDSPDRWVALIVLPTRAIDDHGRLRLAVERVDTCGRRSTWPRRVTPWQDRPGLATIDTTAWDGLSP